jgi:hypothetical protein
MVPVFQAKCLETFVVAVFRNDGDVPDCIMHVMSREQANEGQSLRGNRRWRKSFAVSSRFGMGQRHQ